LDKRGNKYSVVTPLPPTGTNSAGVFQDGTDFAYFVQAGVGSSGTPLYMLLDTGAGTTWVMGSNCQTAACNMHNTFGSADSKTYKPTSNSFEISYGSGSVSGMLAQDTIALAGVKLSMQFGVANVTSDDFEHFPFDGILGLSMSKSMTDNFVDVIKATKALGSNVFAVSLNRNSDGPDNGEITFGGIDQSKFTGVVTYTSVSSSADGDWAIPMDDIAYDGKKAGIKGRSAYIDTGTSFMFGPPADVAAIYKLIPGASTSDQVTYTVPCQANTSLAVSFSGVTYTISPKDWILGPSSSGSCTGNIFGHEVVQGSWLLGDSFLKNVYAIFDVDNNRIGFASRSAVAPGSVTATGSTPSMQTSKGQPTTLVSSQTTSLPASFPGLSGHETPATTDAAAAETRSGPSATSTMTSPGEQLEGNRYASIICIVAIIAIVA
jgi:hypothetical protein